MNDNKKPKKDLRALSSISIVAFVALMLLFPAFGITKVAGQDPSNDDTTAPTVTKVFPPPDGIGILVNSLITGTFSEPVQGVDETTFTLVNVYTGDAVEGTVSYDSDTMTATFKPSSDLAYETKYEVGLTSAITDLAGNPIYNTYWYFLTAAKQPENPPPKEKTPVELIQDLKGTINNMPISKSLKTSLLGPLTNAEKLLTDNDKSNDADVCAKLNDFINSVNDKTRTQGGLTETQANELIRQAEAIQKSIGC